ncbi:hypothetical protein ScPMuIL_009371 [Solemya velum]
MEAREAKTKTKRKLQTRLTESERKRRRRSYDQQRQKSTVNIGAEIERWQELRDQLLLKTDAELAMRLLDCCWKYRLPVRKPDSLRSGAAQKLPAPKPNSSGSGAAQRVVSGLRLRSAFSVTGNRSVWCGGLCAAGKDLACVGGKNSVRTVDKTGRVTETMRLCGRLCNRIVRGDDGELFIGSYVDRNISRVSAEGAVSTFSSLTFSPGGLTPLSSGRLLVCGEGSLYIVTERGVQGVELGVDVKCAADVPVNSKGDVAVADGNGGKVCILDSQYKHVGSYSPTKSGSFRPESLTSDGENFVICDRDNRTIHTIDRQGVCLSVYRTTGDCRGWPFCVDMLPSNCVWVLFDGGHVCVYDQI